MKFAKLAGVALGGALAASSTGIVIVPTNDADALLSAALGSEIDAVSNIHATYMGAADAAGTYHGLSFSPLLGINKGFMLTSGRADIAAGPNNDDGAGDANGGAEMDLPNYGHLYDVAKLAVTFDLDAATQLTFDFAFGSEEYWYYTNSPYNDKFLVFLDDNPQSLALDSLGHDITINNQFLTIDNRPYDPAMFPPENGYGLAPKWGTGTPAGIAELQYDGFTPQLRTSFTASAGSHTLVFLVGDAGDQVLDSGVFISHLFGQGGGGDDGTDETTPEPATMLGLALGAAYLLRIRRRSVGHPL